MTSLNHKSLLAALREVRKHRTAAGRKIGVKATKMVVQTVDLPKLIALLMKRLTALNGEHGKLLRKYGRLLFKHEKLKRATAVDKQRKKEKRTPRWLQPRCRARNPKHESYSVGFETWRGIYGKTNA